MADLHGFDANQVAPSMSFEPLPAGKYQAVITESEMVPTKSGTGEYLKLTFEIIEGTFQGRQLWTRLNLNNPNAQAVQIARAELSAICRAVGVLAPNDSADLHDLPMVIHVKCVKRFDTGDITNEIKGYTRRGGQEPPGSPPTPSPPKTAPWKRG